MPSEVLNEFFSLYRGKEKAYILKAGPSKMDASQRNGCLFFRRPIIQKDSNESFYLKSLKLY